MKGLIFTESSVLAILAGTKTVTRRVIKPQPWECWNRDNAGAPCGAIVNTPAFSSGINGSCCHHEIEDTCGFQVGEVRYVKETYGYYGAGGDKVAYRATLPSWWDMSGGDDDLLQDGWRSPMFMSLLEARGFVQVEKVVVEPVQDISIAECEREGIDVSDCEDSRIVFMSRGIERTYRGPRAAYANLWNSLHAKPKAVKVGGKIDHYASYPWDGEKRTETHRGKEHVIYGNPWVVAVTFKVVDRPEGV